MEKETRQKGEPGDLHRFAMEIPAGMMNELKCFSRSRKRTVENCIRRFVSLRRLMDEASLERSFQGMGCDVSVEGRPIPPPELSLLRFNGQRRIRKDVVFSNRELGPLQVRPNLSLQIRESIALGLEMFEKANDPNVLGFTLGGRRLIFVL